MSATSGVGRPMAALRGFSFSSGLTTFAQDVGGDLRIGLSFPVFLWPSNTWIRRMSTFCSSRWVAKAVAQGVHRNAFVDAGYRRQPRLDGAVELARTQGSGSRPGNSQPPSSILPWARATPPDAQDVQQHWCDSMA